MSKIRLDLYLRKTDFDIRHSLKRQRQHELRIENTTQSPSSPILENPMKKACIDNPNKPSSFSELKNGPRLPPLQSLKPSARPIEKCNSESQPQSTPNTDSESPSSMSFSSNIGRATTALSSTSTSDYNNNDDDLFVRNDRENQQIDINSVEQTTNEATDASDLKKTPDPIIHIGRPHKDGTNTKLQSPKVHTNQSSKANTRLSEQHSRSIVSSLTQPAPAPMKYTAIIDISDDSEQEPGLENAGLHTFQKATRVEPRVPAEVENDNIEEKMSRDYVFQTGAGAVTPTSQAVQPPKNGVLLDHGRNHSQDVLTAHQIDPQNVLRLQELENIPSEVASFNQDERFYELVFQDKEDLPDLRTYRSISGKQKKGDTCYFFDSLYQPLVNEHPGEDGHVLTPFPGALNTNRNGAAQPVFHKDFSGNIRYLGHYTTKGDPRALTRDQMSYHVDGNMKNYWATVLYSRSQFSRSNVINGFLRGKLYNSKVTEYGLTDQELEKRKKDVDKKLKTLRREEILEAFSSVSISRRSSFINTDSLQSHGEPRLPFCMQRLEFKTFEREFYNALDLDIKETRRKVLAAARDRQNLPTSFQSPSGQPNHTEDQRQMDYRGTGTRSEATPVASFSSSLRSLSGATSIDYGNSSLSTSASSAVRARQPIKAEATYPNLSFSHYKYTPPK